MKNPTPLDITKSSKNELVITWNDGRTLYYNVRDLRLACPCASCVDEFTGKPLLNPLSVPEDVFPQVLRSVGKYAMGIEWSDDHKSGIFSYNFLCKHGKLKG